LRQPSARVVALRDVRIGIALENLFDGLLGHKVLPWAEQTKPHSDHGTAQRDRARYIVTITHKRNLSAVQGSTGLSHSQQVRDRLTWMRLIGQPIDDRYHIKAG